MTKLILFLFIITGLTMLAACTNSSEKFDLAKAKNKWNSVDKQWTEKELQVLYSGEKLYYGQCSACHHKEGTGQLQLMGAPGLKNNALMRGDPTIQIKIILNGKRSMPAFAKSLTDDDIAAVASYTRNSWGNNSFNLINLEQVEKIRNDNR